MSITPLYAALLGLIFVVLSVRTLLLRRRFSVAVGDGQQPLLQKAARAHANFAEYVPLAVLLIFFLETQMDVIEIEEIHFLCIALIIGRIVHAYGVSRVDEDYRFRVVGMVLTLGVIIAAAVRLVLVFLRAAVA